MTIKVCGMSRSDNIRQAELLDIDLMGFICWKKSSRFVPSPPSYLPADVRRIGVFVNASPEYIARKIKEFAFTGIQLHGDETPEDIRQLHLYLGKHGFYPQLYKAISVAAADDAERAEAYTCCQGFVFDTRCAGYGGSGLSFDWDLLRFYKGKQPFLLSGGISPGCIQALLNFKHPRWAGIDLNSCFETSPGIKDIELLRSFIAQVRDIPTSDFI